MPESLDDLYDDFVNDNSPEHDDELEHEGILFPDEGDPDDDELDLEMEEFGHSDYGDTEEDEDEDTEEVEEEEEDPENKPTTHDDAIEQSDVIDDLLKAKGILDPTKLNFEDENGELVEVSFYDLSYDEQMNILKTNDDLSTLLDPTEIEAVSFLRRNQVSLEDTIKYYERKAVEDYINSQNINGLEIDQYSDEDLYAMHLRSEYEDLTNDEIEADLQKQLEHPELFKKKVDKLRTEYKEIEEKQLQEAQTEREAQDEQTYEELKTSLISIATGIEDVSGSGLDLDIDDKNEVLDHILKKDLNGVTPFIKSLNSPQQLFELAWFAKKGKEAFDTIHDHYRKVIAETRRSAFEKGKESAKPTQQVQQEQQPKPGRKSVVKRGAKAQSARIQTKTDAMSIDDLFTDY